VRLPGKEFIPIDAKVSLAAYMDYVNASDEEEKATHLAQHAQDVRQHVRTLGGKDYAQHVQGGIDFTVLYLPGDHFLDAAFQRFPQLQDEALAKKVLIATPVTLLALLKTVQLVWRNESVSKDAQKIKDAGVELHSRVRKFAVYLETLGKRIESTAKAYNQATSSFNARLLPKGREITKLIVHGQESEQLSELKDITTVPSLPVDSGDE
jgi:DNA recombination protein RmuC